MVFECYDLFKKKILINYKVSLKILKYCLFLSLQSFFGRSYNNISSISECKNNGECIINKKNRTACKACRLRKCLLVGMSKSGSRYGRRSNWFKIHCLLQEQQAAAQQHANNQKSMPPSAAMIGASGSYTTGPYPPPRPTKEELMMFGISPDESHYKQSSSASPSISSPDSHNSDSSIENEKRNALLHRKMHDAVASTKDLPFLPMPFGGLPLMPPPGFLPPSLFSGYHPALYPHPQSLLNPASVAKDSSPFPTPPSANNNSRFIQNNNNNITKKVEEFSKRFYLDAILSSQKSPFATSEETERENDRHRKISSSPAAVVHLHHHNHHKEEISTITPPRSPCNNNSAAVSAVATIQQDNPIDLSMKASTTNSSEDHASLHGGSVVSEDDATSQEARSNNVSEESGGESDDSSVAVYKNESKRIKIQGTSPLDLTTKA